MKKYLLLGLCLLGTAVGQASEVLVSSPIETPTFEQAGWINSPPTTITNGCVTLLFFPNNDRINIPRDCYIACQVDPEIDSPIQKICGEGDYICWKNEERKEKFFIHMNENSSFYCSMENVVEKIQQAIKTEG